MTEGDASLYIALTGARATRCTAREPVAHALGHRVHARSTTCSSSTSPSARRCPTFRTTPSRTSATRTLRFLAPVYAGDTISCESEVIGVTRQFQRQERRGLRALARLQPGCDVEVLTWARWVMVAQAQARRRQRPCAGGAHPARSRRAARASRVPSFLKPAALDPRDTGGTRLWDDYAAGEVDRPSGRRDPRRGRAHDRHAPLPEHGAHPLRRVPREDQRSSASASSTAGT